MLPKRNRNDRKAVARIFREGRTVGTPALSLKFFVGSGDLRRVSFITPRKVAPRPAARNLLRREGYRALMSHWQELPAGFQGVFILHKHSENISKEMHKLISKAR